MIWFYRGNMAAQETIFSRLPFSLSAVSYMEILQGMRNKLELKKLKKDLTRWGVNIIQIDEGISSNAICLMENYKLSHGLELGDALIAATALKYDVELVTGNTKHYNYIPNIKIIPFVV
jgi:predicted nucleic acid-binding protein